MGIGIIVVALGLMMSVSTTQDLSPLKATDLTYQITEEELAELEKEMEPELFDGVMFYYEKGKEDINYNIDTNKEPLKTLYAQRGVNVRTKPGVHGKVVTTVSSGSEVQVFGEFEDWIYIRANDKEGFTNKSHYSETKPAEKKSEAANKPKASTSNVGPSVMEGGNYAAEMTFHLSFYSNLPEHNGGYSKTASGKNLSYGMVANNVLPFGTKIYLEGWGVVTVEDRGGKGFNTINRLDVFIPPKSGESKQAYIDRLYKLGRQTVKGTILN